MSGLGTSLGAAFCAALFVGFAGGAALAQADVPSTGTLPGGVAYELRADPAQPAAAVALWFRAPAAGFDGAPLPGLARLSALTVAASTPITGTPLRELVRGWGGRVAVASYPDSVSVTALVPADRASDAVRALTRDFFAPVASENGMQASFGEAFEDMVSRSFGAEAIEDAVGRAMFATGPLHDGMVGSASDRSALTHVPFGRVHAFVERAFRPANAILVLTGNVSPAALAQVASRPAGGSPDVPEPPAPQTLATAPGPLERTGEVGGTGLGWAGPPIADEADATAMDFLADALFTARSGVVARALGSRKANVSGRFVTYHDPGLFLVTITGDDAAGARVVVDRAVAQAASPMPAATFAAARAAFVYRLLSDMETPADLADTFGWYAVEGAPAYAPPEGGMTGRYFTLAAQLTPESVARVAAKYLGRPPVAVTVTESPPRART